MMMRKPCSRPIATSSAVAPVAQGTLNSLQAARTRSRFSCTAGWLAWPRNPIDTDMSPGPAQMGADAPHLTQNVADVLHPFCFFDDAHQQAIAVRVQRPEVGGVVVFLRGQAPVSRRDAITPTALPSRCKVLHPRHLGIACRRDCGLGLPPC